MLILIKFLIFDMLDFTNFFLFQHDPKIKVVALSVLINLCSKNTISLSLLEDQTNLMSLQKKIPLETYGVLVSNDNTAQNVEFMLTLLLFPSM